MKYLADENIPLLAIRQLRDAGFDVAWASESSAGEPDEHLLRLATRQDRIIITFDKDFAELIFRQGRPAPSGVLLLRVRPASPGAIAQLLLTLLQSDRPWHGHFSVATEKRIRMIPLVAAEPEP